MIHSKKVIAFVISILLAGLSSSLWAQQPKKAATVGFLALNSLSSVLYLIEGFQQGLHELGYVEGKNIVVEYRSADEHIDRLPGLATELIRLKVDVIVSAGDVVTRVVRKATSTIPIVMGYDNDPVGSGLIASLAHPGGNVTGSSTLSPELSGKRVELLKEVIPGLSRMAIFGSSTGPVTAHALKETELAAEALHVQHQYLDILGAKDIERVFREATKAHAEAVLTLASAIITSHRKELVNLAAKSRLPVMYVQKQFVEDGGLMSYSVSLPELLRRAATYMDKILKGANPANLPVEQPTKFELLISLKAAKQIGLTIPPNVLARADRVIR